MKKGRWIELYYNRQGKRYRDITRKKNNRWESAQSGKWKVGGDVREGAKERRVGGRVEKTTLAVSG